jgi:hypothetical protein
MKKTLLPGLIIFLFAAVAQAQFTKLGGGVGFTTGYDFHEQNFDYNKSGNFNFFAKGIYELTLPIHISPSLTYFFPHVWKQSDPTSESKITVTTLMTDVNGHYVFNSLDRFEFYGLAGLDILLAWKKDKYTVTGASPFEETIRESDNAIGLNLGLGTYIKLTETLDISIEAKYLVSRYDQFMLNAGILLNLQALAKKEKEGN